MGKFVDRFRRIDKWMDTAPVSLIMFSTVVFILGIALVIVLIKHMLPVLPPQQIEIYVDPPKVKIPKE